MIKYLGIGINNYPSAPLRGCVPDIDTVSRFFYKRGVPYRNMRTVTDLATRRATKFGIWDRLYHVCESTKPGDQLIVHYSGHGAQVPERNDGEVDKLTEVLCPVDFDFENPNTWICDNDFVGVFQQLNHDVDCTVILDSCFSGGMVDLGTRGIADDEFPDYEHDIPSIPKAYPLEGNIDLRIRLESAKERPILRRPFLKTSLMPDVCFILGCQEDQTSADAYFASEGYRGALTYHLFKAFAENPQLSRRECVAVAAKAISDDDFSQVPMIVGPDELLRKPFLAKS